MSHLILLFLLLSSLQITIVSSKCVIINFGDSNSDTGGFQAAAIAFQIGLPHGYHFFHRPTGRFCDGRLYIDFICERLKMKFLSPYLESVGSNFENGVNFAMVGGVTQPRLVPFSLHTQVQQFMRFKSRVLEVIHQKHGCQKLMMEGDFGDAIYSIDIGQNDISMAFTANLSYSEIVTTTIPSVLFEIQNATEILYENGARKFWIYNTGPLGCLPQTLAKNKRDDSQLDQNQCLAVYNNAAKAFNDGLRDVCDKLRSTLKNASIVYIDMYEIKYDLIANNAKYGFKQPLMACCGYGGQPYNYQVGKTCGQPNITACPEGSKFVSWDGVHYTQTANEIIASHILSGKYSTPSLNLGCSCDH